MDNATIVTKKDARLLYRLHAALTDMLAGMDGLVPKPKRKRRAVAKRKVAPSTTPSVSKAALRAANAKAKRLAKQSDDRSEDDE